MPSFIAIIIGSSLLLACDTQQAANPSRVVVSSAGTGAEDSGIDADVGSPGPHTPADAEPPADADTGPSGMQPLGDADVPPQGIEGGSPALEGGTCMPIEWSAPVSVCSPDPLVVSTDDYDGMTCSQGCLLPWGCDDYDTARAQLDACVDDGSFNSPAPAFAAQGCGYLTLVSIPRDPYQGFYDPDTKRLVAAFTEDDVGMVRCAGSLPMECVYSYLGQPVLTDQAELCSGRDRDAGADSGP